MVNKYFGGVFMDEFKEKLQGRKHIVIFGRGERGTAMYQKLHSEYKGVSVCFCESDKKLIGKKYLGAEVFSVAGAIKRYPDALFIISAVKSAREMGTQLTEAGLEKNSIIFQPPQVLLEDWEDERKKRRVTPHKKLRFEVNITKHCNLNCKGCDHFAPLAKNDYMDFVNYQCDIKRIAELFGDQANEIHILGGEPLLHPEVTTFLHEARQLFPKAEICLDTNGTLLSRMNSSFWQICREDGVIIQPTVYPVNVDYNALEDYAKEQGVKYRYLQKNKPGGHHTLWKSPLDLSGQQDPMTSFMSCANANRCITLEKGRLYTCSIASNMYLFNQYFEKDYIDFTDDDGIDIYKAKTPEEIFTYLARPMPLCRYCDIKNRSTDHPWECSQKKMEEWV